MTCGNRPSVWRAISWAAAKSAGARLRTLGALSEHPQWPARATVCARCPIRTFRRGQAYCGEPFLSQPDRLPSDGCGCPIADKTKDPNEHCPVNARHRAAEKLDGHCTCKWCEDRPPA